MVSEKSQQLPLILRNFSLNVFFLLEKDPERLFFLADNDGKFLELTKALEKHGIRRFAVVHTRIRGEVRLPDRKGAYHLPPDLVPPDFHYKHATEDLGNEWLELKIFSLD